MIKIALPNKGALFGPTVELLAACGYKATRAGASLSSLDPENGVEFYFLRPGDIPLYVANGMLDAGITGKDFVAEKGLDTPVVLDLHYGHSRLCAAVPVDSKVSSLDEVAGMRIATSHPVITSAYFAGRELALVQLEGAVEISVRLGIAEAVVDVVETGTTLKEAGLRIVGDPLFRSNAALYAHPNGEPAHELSTLCHRIEGKLVALEYMMVEYDVPASILATASAITPGIESPTVTPLQGEGWYSVKAMIKKREAHRIMDELSDVGCKGILLTTIESARI